MQVKKEEFFKGEGFSCLVEIGNRLTALSTLIDKAGDGGGREFAEVDFYGLSGLLDDVIDDIGAISEPLELTINDLPEIERQLREKEAEGFSPRPLSHP